MSDFQFSTDESSMDSKLIEALDYLNRIGEPEKILNDHNSYVAIFQIGYFIAFRTKYVNYSLFIEKKFHFLLGDLLDYLYIINEKYDFSKENMLLTNVPLNTSTFNQRCTSLLFILLYLNNLIVNYYLEFLREFNKTKGLKAYISFLSDEKFVERNQNVENSPYNSIKLGLINYICLNLSRISSDSSDFKHIFQEYNTVNVLINILKKLPKLELYISNILLNISDDKQIETLTEIHHISTVIIKQLHQCAADFNSNSYNRSERQIFLNNKVAKINVHSVRDSLGVITSFHVIFKGLYNLAVNETLRKQIYSEPGIQESLKTILLKGNEEEKNACLKLISQLTFNEDIAKDLKNYESIMQFINTQATQSSNDRTRKHCEQIKWNLKEKEIVPKVIEQKSDGETRQEPGHIMISYNSASRELCLKVKGELEKRGFKVWMDVSDIHGSSLESMANAVENSVCVLMCVTEKYRKSVNCQAEAQYAFKLNKPIIPLIMQKGFENVSGWVGIIMGDKIFINFTKYEFDECVRRLVNEVNSHFTALQIKPITQSVVNHVSTGSAPKPPETQHSTSKPENMNQSATLEWFASNSIDPLIIQYLNSCDGQVLKQIYEMKKSDIEFYNQSLKSIPNISFISIAKFSAALEKLFQ